MAQVSEALASETSKRHASQSLVLGALGVVYGDIGTSPLYAVKQCFLNPTAATPDAVLGVLSLIAWALFVVVTLKYIIVIMNADNRGEGGILALTALALRARSRTGRRHRWVIAAGLVGAALFYGDGVITPAISVLSAVEGLKVATPVFNDFVVPIALVLLIVLFVVQRRGTQRVGGLFGPVMLLWFASIALLGIVAIAQHPSILLAINPWYGLKLLAHDPWEGFVLLGSVVLAVTGAEALYADMGHFGASTIRRAWLRLVFPCLLLNYFGQGALLIVNPEALENPFYRLAPDWALYPLVILASAATVIASQAVISGAFSLSRQAVQLGYLPRLQILHTSEAEIGQVYVPKINLGLLCAVIAVVLGFQSSDRLGGAYGIAVTGTMTITTVLAFVYMRGVVGWTLLSAASLFGFFLVIDLAFFAANMLKVVEGGWFPLLVAAIVYILMSTWRHGRAVVAAQRAKDSFALGPFVDRLTPDKPLRVPGSAIFMTGNADVVPGALLHNIKHNKVLHERNVLMTVHTEDIPHVTEDQRLDIRDLGKGFYTITVHYGFSDQPNIVRALAQCRLLQMRFNLMDTSFFVGREKLLAGKRRTMSRWRKQIFILMANNMLDATEFFRIPPNRVVELGGQTEI
jgi:KUP system potassium uptake protein